MSYSHLSTFERGKLGALHQLGWSSRAIAKELGRHHSTIARELQRNKKDDHSYSPELANNNYQKRRKHSKSKGKWTEGLAHEIEEKLYLTWSPEQIAGRLKGLVPSFKTIYRWIYQGKVIKGNPNVPSPKRKKTITQRNSRSF